MARFEAVKLVGACSGTPRFAAEEPVRARVHGSGGSDPSASSRGSRRAVFSNGAHAALVQWLRNSLFCVGAGRGLDTGSPSIRVGARIPLP